ncbi:MAG: aminotransferase class I/II-fold pyridoxal phosphate-dependent enzyme [Firmicutes bacterium]|nr:aminotransferase class I/II-fold pyridoxal phosphate-dependent enzyme [Bacillota bacterium]
MTDMIFASKNGRNIPLEDKIFGISNRAKAMIEKEGKDKVVNATIGALLDDEGKVIVLSSVDDVFKSLTPDEYAQYAPIGGTPDFKEAVKKDVFRDYVPTRFVEAVATPGGTGAIRNTISNYSNYGDRVLTTDWFWAPYNTIAQEVGRSLITFELFNEKGGFNCEAFETKVKELLEVQEALVIILNTPSHNPTGYALSKEEWDRVVEILNNTPSEKKVTLLVDAAYADFAGEENESRNFFPMLEKLEEHILPVIAHSLSKSYTLYGLRGGAMLCMAKTKEVAEEFKRVCEFSARASWSNCPRAVHVILSKIYADEQLLAKVMEERKGHRDMLIRRGVAFMEEAEKIGLETVPFRSGFFMTIPCAKPEAVAAKLEEEGIFTVPLAKGIRVSGASISEEVCRRLPKAIKNAIETV